MGKEIKPHHVCGSPYGLQKVVKEMVAVVLSQPNPGNFRLSPDSAGFRWLPDPADSRLSSDSAGFRWSPDPADSRLSPDSSGF
ncbi:unnamed protein product [Adineta ricciae]|uniref:Uncharacterized protein n=1 Tax=Adineta ricciae TaxID=249248 RepID=A0A813UJT5_ADIRI|nr:unnamed protein product [Adineta ricciae]